GDSSPSNTASAKPMPPLPKAPSQLTATPVSPGVVRLSWTASPSPNVMYWIYFRMAGDSAWVKGPWPVNGLSINMADAFYNGELYQFQITAGNLAGESPRTGIARAVVPRQNYTTSRLMNDINGSNGLAQGRVALGGGPCEGAQGQTVCFNSQSNLTYQPMT